MKRREFIAGLGSAAAWPLVAQAQQDDRVRRIGVLMPLDENDPVSKLQRSTLPQALADLGWTDGRNVRIDFRWASGDINRIRAFARELVGLQPDIIIARGTPATVAVQQETRTIPIVFVGVAVGREPGGGLVVMPDQFMNVHRAPIISAAAQNNVPAVYPLSYFARDGGLLSYAPCLNSREWLSYTPQDRQMRTTGCLATQYSEWVPYRQPLGAPKKRSFRYAKNGTLLVQNEGLHHIDFI